MCVSKLADKRQKQPYIVTSQPIPDIPIYEVQRENGHPKPKIVHRNMILPFVGLDVESIFLQSTLAMFSFSDINILSCLELRQKQILESIT